VNLKQIQDHPSLNRINLLCYSPAQISIFLKYYKHEGKDTELVSPKCAGLLTARGTPNNITHWEFSSTGCSIDMGDLEQILKALSLMNTYYTVNGTAFVNGQY
jgi:hypothetical protein